jgi:hypothetical protein
MPRGRPRKSAEYHRLMNNYCPSRHAEPAVTSPVNGWTGSKPQPAIALMRLGETPEVG